MNKIKNTLSIVERAKNTFVGRIVCRAMGEETGAVMMEYVIIAVMIAAAVAVAAWYFGRSVSNEMRVASHAVVGGHDTAVEVQTSAQGAVAGQDDQARTEQKNVIELKNADAADL